MRRGHHSQPSSTSGSQIPESCQREAVVKIVVHCLPPNVHQAAMRYLLIWKAYAANEEEAGYSAVQNFGNAALGGQGRFPESYYVWAILFTKLMQFQFLYHSQARNHFAKSPENVMANQHSPLPTGFQELPRRGCSAESGWLLNIKFSRNYCVPFAAVKVFHNLFLWADCSVAKSALVM